MVRGREVTCRCSGSHFRGKDCFFLAVLHSSIDPLLPTDGRCKPPILFQPNFTPPPSTDTVVRVQYFSSIFIISTWNLFVYCRDLNLKLKKKQTKKHPNLMNYPAHEPYGDRHLQHSQRQTPSSLINYPTLIKRVNLHFPSHWFFIFIFFPIFTSFTDSHLSEREREKKKKRK